MYGALMTLQEISQFLLYARLSILILIKHLGKVPECEFSLDKMIIIYKNRKYIYVGVWNTIFSLAIFQILLHFCPVLHYQVILFITFLIANFQSHFTQRKFVWKSKKNYFVEFAQFLLGSVFSYMINVVALAILIRITTIRLIYIQSVITICLLAFSYVLHSKIIFNYKN